MPNLVFYEETKRHMYIPANIPCLAYTGVVEEIRLLIPLVVLAAFCLAIEITLNRLDKTFSQNWWFVFASAISIIADLTWSSWTASTPMADIINYGETSGHLIFAIASFLFVVALLLFWTVLSGVRQIFIEAPGGGWGWGVLRIAPLAILAWLLFEAMLRGNAAVGGDGLMRLLGL